MESPRPGGQVAGLKNCDAPRGDRWDGATFAFTFSLKQLLIAIAAGIELAGLLKIYASKCKEL